MFSQLSVILSTGGGVFMARGACMAGGVHGRGCAWQGVCGGGHAWQGGMCGWGACMVGGCMAGVCVVGGGACMAGEMATAAESMHPTGMHSC